MLTFVQIGMITLTAASSLLQPIVGYWTDKYPMPWSLPIGMCFTLSGLVLLAYGGKFLKRCCFAAALVGTGSSASSIRVLAWHVWPPAGATGRRNHSSVGGNFGSSLGLLLAAVIIAPYSKVTSLRFVLAALLAIVVLAQISPLVCRTAPRKQRANQK